LIKDSIFVNCWKCKKKFDITSAERCYKHLNYYTFPPDQTDREHVKWTTKCSHCGTCICHKADKMKPLCESALENSRLLESGITEVMPSVHKKLCHETLQTKSSGDKI